MIKQNIKMHKDKCYIFLDMETKNGIMSDYKGNKVIVIMLH